MADVVGRRKFGLITQLLETTGICSLCGGALNGKRWKGPGRPREIPHAQPCFWIGRIAGLTGSWLRCAKASSLN